MNHVCPHKVYTTTAQSRACRRGRTHLAQAVHVHHNGAALRLAVGAVAAAAHHKLEAVLVGPAAGKRESGGVRRGPQRHARPGAAGEATYDTMSLTDSVEVGQKVKRGSSWTM